MCGSPKSEFSCNLSANEKWEVLKEDYFKLLHKMKDGRIRNVNIVDFPAHGTTADWNQKRIYVGKDGEGEALYESRGNMLKKHY